ETYSDEWYKYNIPKKYQDEKMINKFIEDINSDNYNFLYNIKILTDNLVVFINKNPILIHRLNRDIRKDIWFNINKSAKDIIIKKYSKSKIISLIMTEFITMTGKEFNDHYSTYS